MGERIDQQYLASLRHRLYDPTLLDTQPAAPQEPPVFWKHTEKNEAYYSKQEASQGRAVSPPKGAPLAACMHVFGVLQAQQWQPARLLRSPLLPQAPTSFYQLTMIGSMSPQHGQSLHLPGLQRSQRLLQHCSRPGGAWSPL